MGFVARLSIGILLIVTGAVLALGFAEAEFLFLTGRLLGVVLVILGLFDVYQGFRARERESGGGDA